MEENLASGFQARSATNATVLVIWLVTAKSRRRDAIDATTSGTKAESATVKKTRSVVTIVKKLDT